MRNGHFSKQETYHLHSIVSACLKAIMTVEDNKTTVLAFYQAALNDRDADATVRYHRTSYRQHDPGVESGYDGLRKYPDRLPHPACASQAHAGDAMKRHRRLRWAENRIGTSRPIIPAERS